MVVQRPRIFLTVWLSEPDSIPPLATLLRRVAVPCSKRDKILSRACVDLRLCLPFHDLDFFRRQAIERINLLVYLSLQRGCVRLGVPLLRREDTVNYSCQSFLGFVFCDANWDFDELFLFY